MLTLNFSQKDFDVAVVAGAMFDTSSSDMNELCFMADTEASDGPTDVELGRADYWTCVKCKNRQNNPMYRYCEKCYQVNYNFFFYYYFRVVFCLLYTSVWNETKRKHFCTMMMIGCVVDIHYYRSVFLNVTVASKNKLQNFYESLSCNKHLHNNHVRTRLSTALRCIVVKTGMNRKCG